MRQRIATDGHAPGQYRALTVRNLDAWYKAFNVQQGQKLYLAPDKRVPIYSRLRLLCAGLEVRVERVAFMRGEMREAFARDLAHERVFQFAPDRRQCPWS